MILGLRTAVYPVTDLEKAKAWYSAVVGAAPYFDSPFYVGYQVGGFELGLIPNGSPGTIGVMVYWGTADIALEAERITALGAKTFEAVHDVGQGIRVATLLDPFGNMFGIIENPHFDRANVS